MNTYATLTAFRTRLGLAAQDTTDDARLLARLRAASAQIDALTKRRFNPYRAVETFDYRGPLWATFGSLTALELLGVTNGDGTIIPPGAITSIGKPIHSIELDPAGAAFIYTKTPRAALSADAIWGYHTNYATAWRQSNDNPVFSLTSVTTTIAVGLAGGPDSNGIIPRFQAGQLIKIDSEFMHVIAVDTVNNTLTVVRAANGTTAATHAAGTPTLIYTPPADLAEITLRWAGWLLRLEDSGDLGGQIGYRDVGVQTIASALPPDVLTLIAPYRAV